MTRRRRARRVPEPAYGPYPRPQNVGEWRVQQAWLKRQQARRRRAARRLERDRAWQLWMSQPLAVRVEKVSKWCNEVRAELGIEPVPLPPGEAQP